MADASACVLNISMDWVNGGIVGVLAFWGPSFSWITKYRIDTLYPATLGYLQTLKMPLKINHRASFEAAPATLIRFSGHR